MKTLKKIKSAAHTLLTIAVVAVMIIAFCTVDINELKLMPIVVFFAAEAWIVYSIKKVCKGGAVNG